jgi:hypothetical protein
MPTSVDREKASISFQAQSATDLLITFLRLFRNRLTVSHREFLYQRNQELEWAIARGMGDRLLCVLKS